MRRIRKEEKGLTARMEEMLPDMSTINRPSPSPTFRFIKLAQKPDPTPGDDPLELHESDVVWSFAVSPAPHPRPNPNGRHRFNPERSGLSSLLSDERHNLVGRKSSPRVIPQEAGKEDTPVKYRQSAPVNIPPWPKNPKRLDDMEDDGGGISGGEEREMVPPHVIVARSHVTFSVFEGAGRTLKGRDLRRLRNTVLQKTGFID